MSVALVDSTVIIHLLRRFAPALRWYKTQTEQLSMTSTVWLEIMEGAPSKNEQTRYRELLDQFELLYPTREDQIWSMQQLERFQFSHHIGKEDCQIAAVAARLQVPLYTHNLRDMIPLMGALATLPYS